MAIVTDPVCGMRIDPADAVASVEHSGQTYWFCSEACREVFAVDPEPDAERLTAGELATRGQASRERIAQLVELGLLKPSPDGTFARADVMRVRNAAYLADAGIAAEDLARGLRSGHLTLGYLEAAGRRHPRAQATYAELAAEIGLGFDALERIFVAFGIRRPQPDDPAREEDAAIIRTLGVLLGARVAEDDVLRMARVWGDSVRRVAQYLPHYFHEIVEERFRARGLGDNQAFEAAIREVGLRIGRSGEDLLGWLFRGHVEVFMTEHQLEHVETALEAAGIRRRLPPTPEAAVFADLSDYTRLTEESGDEVAADAAVAFARLAGEIAAEHRGSVVKLLGDGVLLHFADPADAVRASLDLVERAPAKGLPAAHVGVNAGPILYDEGDYFGRTVNIASRIAALAGPGSVYVGESVEQAVDGRPDAGSSGFQLRDVGAFELKGVAEPVRVLDATLVRN